MKMRLISVSLMLLLCSSVFAQSVDFIEPKNNANVSSPFKVKFAVNGMQVALAGEMKEGTGHHHLLINAADIPEGTVILSSCGCSALIRSRRWKLQTSLH
jgi:hypothetical protein